MTGVQTCALPISSALNRADILQREGNYPVPPGAPADISGLEYAGEVDAVGPSVSLRKQSDQVMGIVGGGGHAEYVCVHEREAMPIPTAMSWEEAAAIPEAFLTAYDALFNRLKLKTDETLLIHAVASGVGTAGLQLGRVAGAKVVGTARSPEKLERARKLGLDVGIDSSRKDWPAQIEKAVGLERVNAVMDLVGGSYLEGNLRVLALRGRIVVVGLTGGATAQFNLGALMRKRLTIVGTVLRSRPLEEKIELARDFSEHVVPLFEAGRITPVVDRVLPFNAIRAAHELMESNETFGKIVLRWE